MSNFVDGRVRTVLRAEGLLIFIAALYFYHDAALSWRQFAVLFLVPDLSLLGYLAGARIGAFMYNIAHSYIGAIATLLLSLLFNQLALLPLALIWIAHIGFDRTLGYGLKFGTGFRDTHLGVIGRAKTAI